MVYIATMIEKAPQGGYMLSNITFRDGEEPLIERVCCKTALSEISLQELAMKQQAFKEDAWFKAPEADDGRIVNKVAERVMSMIRQTQQEQSSPPPPPVESEPFEMPKVYGGNGHDHEVERLTAGLTDRVGSRVATFVAFAFCSAVAMSFSLRGLVT